MLTTNYYNDFFEFGQQKINFSFFELSLPDDDPVYTLKKVMEELDFSGLLANCSDKGRTGYNPIMMYAVVTYANMRGIRSVDRIVDLCERDLAFIWLTRGQKPKRDAFYDFKNRKLTSDVLDDLNYQFMRRLQKEGLVTLKELFIDGTKIEANANRYTFVWRGSINYHLAGLLDSIDQLFEKYNSFLQENDYGTKYELGNAQMFVIEGMDKVREVIEKNRKRKLVKHNLCPRPELLFLPGAVGACPIGSIQAVVGSWNFKMAYYVIGFLIFIGALLGRLVCGFLCPFGLIQDLLNKIPFPNKIRTFKGDKLLRRLKYVIFLVFVILLPMFVVDIMGQGAPYFCKLICPAGTLEGGIPLVLLNKSMRSAVG